MTAKPLFFVCGTPSNKRGFEWTCAGDRRMPGEPSAYLDIFAPDQMAQGRTFVSKSLELDGNPYALVGLYQRINPNDSRTNRGAYVAAGALLDGPVRLDDGIAALCYAQQLLGRLDAYRDGSNAFARGFELKDFVFGQEYKDFPAIFVLDSMCGAWSEQTGLAPKRFVFNEVTSQAIGRAGRYFFTEFENADQRAQDQAQVQQLEAALQKERQTAQELDAKVKNLKQQLRWYTEQQSYHANAAASDPGQAPATVRRTAAGVAAPKHPLARAPSSPRPRQRATSPNYQLEPMTQNHEDSGRRPARPPSKPQRSRGDRAEARGIRWGRALTSDAMMMALSGVLSLFVIGVIAWIVLGAMAGPDNGSAGRQPESALSDQDTDRTATSTHTNAQGDAPTSAAITPRAQVQDDRPQAAESQQNDRPSVVEQRARQLENLEMKPLH